VGPLYPQNSKKSKSQSGEKDHANRIEADKTGTIFSSSKRADNDKKVGVLVAAAAEKHQKGCQQTIKK